jgi:hypothetical protein
MVAATARKKIEQEKNNFALFIGSRVWGSAQKVLVINVEKFRTI